MNSKLFVILRGRNLCGATGVQIGMGSRKVAWGMGFVTGPYTHHIQSCLLTSLQADGPWDWQEVWAELIKPSHATISSSLPWLWPPCWTCSGWHILPLGGEALTHTRPREQENL